MDAKIVFKPGLRGDNLVKVGDMEDWLWPENV